jgi:hypothetical protein
VRRQTLTPAVAVGIPPVGWLSVQRAAAPTILRPMPKPGLTGSWIAGEATLPPEWRLMGVVRGPREVDPKISSDSWVAWARGPKGERVDGQVSRLRARSTI